MNAQALANALWSFFILAATRGVPLPAGYPSLWRLVCGLDVGSFDPTGIRMMFHAHLIHTELVSGDVLDDVVFPSWIVHEAREAWMRSARTDVTVPTWVKEAASIIGVLGVPYEVEHLTNDGYFCVDVYMPDDDVVLEFDGPTHFNTLLADTGEGGVPGDASRGTWTRTPRTELRDMFLKRRHHAVVSVPWFEWAELSGSEDRSHYIAGKLQGAGVRIPASA
jgi:hypothetical protein